MDELGAGAARFASDIVSFVVHLHCLFRWERGKASMDQDKRRRFEENSIEHLREEGIYWEIEAARLKQAIAAALSRQLERRGLTLSEFAKSLGTSRAALNRVLDPANSSITLTTLTRTAAALGCKVKLEIVVPR
jgi:DNA-binding Xre family transcriptional regulator